MYNSSREPIIRREYGRNVQKLVESINSVTDRGERTVRVRSVLKLMSLLDTSSHQGTESQQKHWNDLFAISGPTLDVDGPYPTPEKKEPNRKSSHVCCVKKPVMFRQYGRHVERFVQEAVKVQDLEKQEEVVLEVIGLMKKFSDDWNKDNVNIDTLLANLKHMSGDQFSVDLDKIKSKAAFSRVSRSKVRTGRSAKGVSKKRQAG